MGAIKDVVDLATKLAESIQDRKFAADLFKIIQLISTIQSDQASLTENNVQLMSDKTTLQNTISALESNIARLNQQISELQNPSNDNSFGISDLTKNILLYSSKIDNGVSTHMVQHNFSISNAKAKLEINELRNAKLIKHGAITRMQDTRYIPTYEGLQLLNVNKLI